MKASSYSRGQLAAHTGVKGETIRYYENCGLLPAPPRSAGGHRIYSEQHARQLQFIRRCRELGFAITEIEGLLSLANQGQRSCDQVRQLTQAHLEEVEGKLRDLKKMEQTLKSLVRDCARNSTPSCPIIEILSA